MIDIIEFLKSAKSCVDIIIKELEELKDMEEHKMKKIFLFIEIITELGTSVTNLESAYKTPIPLEHKLKYLIIKELKFDLEDFRDSIKEYKIWYNAVKKITQPSCCFNFKCKTRWFCCGSNISNVTDPSELRQMIETNDVSGFEMDTKKFNIIDASIQLANILPSTMNKRLDDSFHKIMEKLMIVIELEKDIFGTAINIKHPVLRSAWMSLGPTDKLQTEVEQYKLEESLLAMLKDENLGIIVNENKCRELISEFLEGLEKKAGNKPNGRISIEELNECVVTDTNTQNVLALLGLKTQPGCDQERSDDNNLNTNTKTNVSTDQVLKTLAKLISEHLKNSDKQDAIDDQDISETTEVSINDVELDYSTYQYQEENESSRPNTPASVEQVQQVVKQSVQEVVEPSSPKKMYQQAEQTQQVEQVSNSCLLFEQIIEPNSPTEQVEQVDPSALEQIIAQSVSLAVSSTSTTHSETSEEKKESVSLKASKNSVSSPSRESIKVRIKRSSLLFPQRQLSTESRTKSEYALRRLYKLSNPVFVNPSDNSGILCCDGYGSNWPYKIIFEYDIVEDVKHETFGGIIFKCECVDQGWGGTGHCNIRYQIGSNKIIPAIFIDREKNPSGIYTYLVKPEEFEPNAHITVWLCCPPWNGWSAELKSATIDIKIK